MVEIAPFYDHGGFGEDLWPTGFNRLGTSHIWIVHDSSPVTSCGRLCHWHLWAGQLTLDDAHHVFQPLDLSKCEGGVGKLLTMKHKALYYFWNLMWNNENEPWMMNFLWRFQCEASCCRLAKKSVSPPTEYFTTLRLNNDNSWVQLRSWSEKLATCIISVSWQTNHHHHHHNFPQW